MAKGEIYVYSTLSTGTDYAVYEKGGADVPVLARVVTIHGGANMADKRLITPRGVLTTVSADDYELLKANSVFQLHEKNGFIRVETKKVDPEVAAADMEGRDKSAPITPEDVPEPKSDADVKVAPKGGSRKA